MVLIDNNNIYNSFSTTVSPIFIGNTSNVGINTNAPINKLHIIGADNGSAGQGHLTIDYANASAAGGSLTLRNSGGGIGSFASILFELDNSTSTATASDTSTDFKKVNTYNKANGMIYCQNNAANNVTKFGIQLWNNVTDSVEVLTILPNGNVGIGSTNPGYPLHVVGAIYSSADITAYSDRRVKTNIEIIDSPLDKLSKINGYYYVRSDLEDKKRCVGVIAQELLEVLPEVVFKGDDDHYSVAYGNIVALLIEALKEEVELRKKLEERVAALENKMGSF